MEGLYTELYNKKNIVVIDYSMVPHEKEFDLMKHSLQYITKYDKSSALVLEIIAGVKLNKEILDYFPGYYEKIKVYVKRWASVGFGKMIFKEMISSKQIPSSAAKNRNVEWFETKEEAIVFLTQI